MSFVSTISIAAKNVGVASHLLIALCDTETGLRPVNNFDDPNGGSYGICQIQLETAREFGSHYDILALQQVSVNAYIAARYLKKKIDLYGRDLGIASYNSGSPRYNEAGQLINSIYVQRVLDKLQKLEYN